MNLRFGVFLSVLAWILLSSVTFGFGRYGYGLFVPSIRQQFDASSAQLGVISSLNTVVFLLVTLASSYLVQILRPQFLLILSGLLTTFGLALVGMSSSFTVAATGIIVSGIGAGIFAPIVFEAIDSWLDPKDRVVAVTALSAGATPGLILTGLFAVYFTENWQLTWIVMALFGFLVVLLNAAAVLPDARLRETQFTEKLEIGKFLRARLLPFYAALLLHGSLYGIYIAFGLDLVVSTGNLMPPYDGLFWVVLGLFGIPALFAGFFARRFGYRLLISVTFPTCGLSFMLLAGFPDVPSMVFLSAALFGFTSIAIGGGTLLWALDVLGARPSYSTATVFVVFSVGMSIGPSVLGVLEGIYSSTSMFHALGLLSIAIVFAVYAGGRKEI